MNQEVDCGWANLERFLGALRVIYGNSRQQAKLIPKAMAKAELIPKAIANPTFLFSSFFSFS